MIQLMDPKGQNNPMLGAIHAAEVTVINDIKPSLISFTTDKLSIKQSDKKIVIPLCRLYNTVGEAALDFELVSSQENSVLKLASIGTIIMKPGEELANLEISIPQKVSPVNRENVAIKIHAPRKSTE